MKKILTLLLLVQSTLLFSQQAYQSVVEGRTAYYEGNPGYFGTDSGQVYAVRIDSIENLVDGKTLFQYGQLDNYQSYCLGSSWIGAEIIARNDGWNLFIINPPFNYYYNEPDTFQLKTNSLIGESSEFYRFDDSSYFELTCTDISFDTVLSGMDSVKSFSILLKNADGSNASSTWNQKEIKLSKSKGLTLFYNLLNVHAAYESEVINLIGFTNPIEGYQPPTAASIFDFAVGDEFHTANIESWFGGYWHDHFEKKIIIDKQVSANGDTLWYTVSDHKVTLTWINFQYQGPTESTYTFTNKVVISDFYPIDSLPYFIQQHPTYNLSNDWFFAVGFDQKFRSSFCNRDLTIVPSYFGAVDSPSGCLNDYLCFGACWVYEFAPGLGIVRKYSIDYPDDYGYDLQYFKKGNDSCGHPINFQLWLGEENIFSSDGLKVFPNPVTDELTIQSEQFIQQIEVMNELGNMKIFSKEEISPQILKINVENFSPGIYFLKIYSDNNVSMRKVVIQ